MTTSPTGEVRFDHAGQSWTLVFDWDAIAAFERESRVSIVEAMAGIEAAQKAGRAPMLSHVAWLVQAGLLRHHPGTTATEAMAMIANPEVLAQLGVAVESAMPPAEAVTASAAGNAPAPLQESPGTKRSKPRSKRG